MLAEILPVANRLNKTKTGLVVKTIRLFFNRSGRTTAKTFVAIPASERHGSIYFEGGGG